MVACPSQALVVLYRILFGMYLTFMFGMLFLFLTTSLGCFLSTDFAFRIADWTCCHGPHLHAILRIIGRGFSGLATDSPCGVWGRGWTTCLLHDSPLFGSHFKMVCKFGVIFHMFIIISCLGSRFHAWNSWWFFLLYNNLFIFQVLCTLIYRRRSLYYFLSNKEVAIMVHA